MSELSLVRADRARTWLDDRRRRVPRLAGPQWQLHVSVDGMSIVDRATALNPHLWGNVPVVSVADSASPAYSAMAVRALARPGERGEDSAGLAEGRIALYGCAICGDLGCGSITVAVSRVGSPSGSPMVRWEQVRFEDGLTPAAEMPDLSAIGPFTFDAARYDAVLAEAVDTLRGLSDEDEAAVADWRRHHSLGGRMRRLLNR